MYGSVGAPDDLTVKAKGRWSVVNIVALLRTSTARGFILLTLIYWTAFTCQQLTIKDVVSGSAHFWHKKPVTPYPLLLTGIVNGLAASFCIVAVIATRLAAKAFPDSKWTQSLTPNLSPRQVQIMLLAGLLEGVERGCMNKSFEWLTLATRTQLFSTQIAFTLAVAWMGGLEQVDTARMVSVCILVLGGMMQGFGMTHLNSGSVSMVGVFLVLASMIASSIRWSLIQMVHKMSKTHPDAKPGQMLTITMISIAKPVDCIFCIGLSFVFEHVRWSTFTDAGLKAWWCLAFLILITVVCDNTIVRLAGAVAFGVVANLGNIPMIVGGVFFNDEHVILSQLLGFSTCTCGALIYFASKAGLFDHQQTTEKDQPKPPLILSGKLMEEGLR
eukprot:gnl/TRDRNA2_/TRDRNA2_174200_c0_seq1.p1 gnl/TRDRNA2_/TRDRNA2_174200_c0~~gnl/TRDRNA2_/TRDRNA2_174200_c0_seq1.p1  ORF type:complete len:386 (+),score=53.31 gnl/TRDRNA2_/TRDRNA2_174200_c0_seq1:72-1229(+)